MKLLLCFKAWFIIWTIFYSLISALVGTEHVLSDNSALSWQCVADGSEVRWSYFTSQLFITWTQHAEVWKRLFWIDSPACSLRLSCCFFKLWTSILFINSSHDWTEWTESHHDVIWTTLSIHVYFLLSVTQFITNGIFETCCCFYNSK